MDSMRVYWLFKHYDLYKNKRENIQQFFAVRRPEVDHSHCLINSKYSESGSEFSPIFLILCIGHGNHSSEHVSLPLHMEDDPDGYGPEPQTHDWRVGGGLSDLSRYSSCLIPSYCRWRGIFRGTGNWMREHPLSLGIGVIVDSANLQ